jgi:hypothetical protein
MRRESGPRGRGLRGVHCDAVSPGVRGRPASPCHVRGVDEHVRGSCSLQLRSRCGAGDGTLIGHAQVRASVEERATQRDINGCAGRAAARAERSSPLTFKAQVQCAPLIAPRPCDGE